MCSVIRAKQGCNSVKLDVTTLARAVRGHGAVEHSQQWVLAVQISEDDSRGRTGYAAENLAALRRLALSLLKREATKQRKGRGQPLTPVGITTTPAAYSASQFRCVGPEAWRSASGHVSQLLQHMLLPFHAPAANCLMQQFQIERFHSDEPSTIWISSDVRPWSAHANWLTLSLRVNLRSHFES